MLPWRFGRVNYAGGRSSYKMLEYDPILYLGVDIGFARDSSSVAAVYRRESDDPTAPPTPALWGHRIWAPPKGGRIEIHQTVVPMLDYLLTNHRVAIVYYDNYQFVSEAERLVATHGDRFFHEVNQQSQNPKFTALLHSLINEQQMLSYEDPTARAHLRDTATRATERGPRIDKIKQTQRIDFTVTLGMACLALFEDDGAHVHAAYSQSAHATPLEALP